MERLVGAIDNFISFLYAYDFTYQLISKNQIFAKEMWVAHPFDVIWKIES